MIVDLIISWFDPSNWVIGSHFELIEHRLTFDQNSGAFFYVFSNSFCVNLSWLIGKMSIRSTILCTFSVISETEPKPNRRDQNNWQLILNNFHFLKWNFLQHWIKLVEYQMNWSVIHFFGSEDRNQTETEPIPNRYRTESKQTTFSLIYKLQCWSFVNEIIRFDWKVSVEFIVTIWASIKPKPNWNRWNTTLNSSFLTWIIFKL